MPTGSGKTSVIMMAPYVTLAEKVLIITSSKLVRGQISSEFSELITLKSVNVFTALTVPPKVFEMKKKYSEQMRGNIQVADVVVATPLCALSISENDIKGQFDLVLVDEAHHIPALTWQQILLNMKDAMHFLFTATPFRLDRKEIKGELIYTYPLSMAYQDGIFGSIEYIPIEEAPDKDLLIAKETERILLNDREMGYNHYVMVRTDTKEKAKKLEIIYKQETNLHIRRIDSSMSYKIIKKYIAELKNKIIDGILCVDMLGEGFDFPNLKIAAIHSPHKSLSSTLQFIGRFTRTNATDIGTAKFIAMNDNDLIIENQSLYANDAIWQDIIINLNDSKIQSEEEIRANLKNYIRDDGRSFSDEVSLYCIRPNCHAKVFRISNFNINGEFPVSCQVGDNIYRNNLDNSIIGIGVLIDRPKWSTSEQLQDIENYLFIVHYQSETSLLFIYSQMKSEIDYTEIASAFSSDFEKIPRNEVHRVLGGLNSFELFNTGMQNRFAEQGESYRILAGSNVASSIDTTTGEMFSAGHVFCKAIDNDGKEKTIGYSSGSKIWSSQYLRIPDYIEWCDYHGLKIANDSLVVKTNTNYDSLPMPKRLSKYPSKIMFSFFSDKTYISPPIIVDSAGSPTGAILTDATILIVDQQDNLLTLRISINDLYDLIECNINGEYNCQNPTLYLKNGRYNSSLPDYLNTHPLIFKATDESVIHGNEISEGVETTLIYPSTDICEINWRKYQTDIHCEYGNLSSGQRSIQESLNLILSETNNFDILLYDHGTGEIADFISIKESDFIEITFYHVKAMGGITFNENVGDIYEVCQQAIKSLIWIKSKTYLLDKIKARQRSNHCIFYKGTSDKLESILKQNKLLRTTIIIVQPAISKNKLLSEKFQEILAAANSYIKNRGRRTYFNIWGSN
jgi:superfamily II DNA or RNA helicase